MRAVPSESIAPLTVKLIVGAVANSARRIAADWVRAVEKLVPLAPAAPDIAATRPPPLPPPLEPDPLPPETDGTTTFGTAEIAPTLGTETLGTLIDGAEMSPTLGKNGIEL